MKRLATTTIECGSAEITITGEVLPGSRATRDEPGSGAELNGILYAMRAEPCSSIWTRAGCTRAGKHTHNVALDLAHLEHVVGAAAWSEIEERLIEAAVEQDDDGPDPDDARDQREDR